MNQGLVKTVPFLKSHKKLIFLASLSFALISNEYSLAATPKDREPIIIEEAPYTDKIDGEGNLLDYLKPYNERKKDFGGSVAINYNAWTPLNYQPDFFADGDFEDIYGVSGSAMISVYVEGRYNTALGAFGAQLGVGTYNNVGESDSELSVQAVFVLLNWTLDTLFPEPYLAPFVSIGLGQLSFVETLGSQESGGQDSYVYYEAGMLFQLDWLDRRSDVTALMEGGIENTYLMVGINGFSGTPSDDKDFSTDPALIAGIRVQF